VPLRTVSSLSLCDLCSTVIELRAFSRGLLSGDRGFYHVVFAGTPIRPYAGTPVRRYDRLLWLRLAALRPPVLASLSKRALHKLHQPARARLPARFPCADKRRQGGDSVGVGIIEQSDRFLRKTVGIARNDVASRTGGAE
jgi:hypothetical protein